MTDKNQNIEDEPKKSFVIFGRDITQIPCFRNSFLYGISGGVVVGALTFLATSRTKFATNIGFGTFFCGTIVYWINCRYEWSKKRFQYNQLQAAMRKHAIYEGTDLERKIREKSEDA